MRRPSPALVVALIALFVALGGPAAAAGLIRGSQIKKNTITSRQVKNHSLSTKDLSRRAVRTLRVTPNGSVTQSKLANGAVTSAKIAGAAITGAKIATNSIGALQIADGSLTTADVARFSGRFSVRLPTIQPGSCWNGVPQGVLPATANINQDVVAITPASTNWDPLRLQASLSIFDGGHFSLHVCNVLTAPSSVFPPDKPAQPAPVGTRTVVFQYAIFTLP
jgi:hypothetical protein